MQQMLPPPIAPAFIEPLLQPGPHTSTHAVCCVVVHQTVDTCAAFLVMLCLCCTLHGAMTQQLPGMRPPEACPGTPLCGHAAKPPNCNRALMLPSQNISASPANPLHYSSPLNRRLANSTGGTARTSGATPAAAGSQPPAPGHAGAVGSKPPTAPPAPPAASLKTPPVAAVSASRPEHQAALLLALLAAPLCQHWARPLWRASVPPPTQPSGAVRHCLPTADRFSSEACCPATRTSGLLSSWLSTMRLAIVGRQCEGLPIRCAQ
jgi:hypothetical protein